MATSEATALRTHFILIKRGGSTRTGERVTAMEAAKLLLECGLWPLWERTRCRKMLGAGNRVLIYLAGSEVGCGKVVASAVVDAVEPWSVRRHHTRYPLILDETPDRVLSLTEVKFFRKPVSVRDKLDQLSFTSSNRAKWGSAFMGGVRSVSQEDYEVLSAAQSS